MGVTLEIKILETTVVTWMVCRVD